MNKHHFFKIKEVMYPFYVNSVDYWQMRLVLSENN